MLGTHGLSLPSRSASATQEERHCPGHGGSAGWSTVSQTERWQVRFPVTAHAQVVCSFPRHGVYKKTTSGFFSLTSIFLSLSTSNNGKCPQGRIKTKEKEIMKGALGRSTPASWLSLHKAPRGGAVPVRVQQTGWLFLRERGGDSELGGLGQT